MSSLRRLVDQVRRADGQRSRVLERFATSAQARLPSSLSSVPGRIGTPRRQSHTVPSLGAYSFIRLASIGPAPRLLARHGVRDLLRSSSDDPAAFDLVLIDLASATSRGRLGPPTVRALLRCERAAVATVAVIDDRSQLASSVASVCRAVATTTPGLAESARAMFGDEGAILLPDNPLGRDEARRVHRPWARPHALVISDSTSDDAADQLRSRGIPVRRLYGRALWSHRELQTAAGRASVALGPRSAAPGPAWGAVVRMAAEGVPVVLRASPRTSVLPLLAVEPSEEEAIDRITALHRRATDRGVAAARSWRAALHHHAPRRIVEALLAGVGIPLLPQPLVSCVTVLHSASALERLRTNITRQDYGAMETVVVVEPHDLGAVRQAIETWESSITVIERPPGSTRSDALNLAVARAAGETVAIIDDVGVYGPHHVSDRMLAWEQTGADVVGASERFVYDRVSNVTVHPVPTMVLRRRPHVAGPTMLLSRATIRRTGLVRNAQAFDRSLCDRIRAAGGVVLALHPFGSLTSGRASRWGSRRSATPGEAIQAALPEGVAGIPVPPLPSDRGALP